MKECQKELLQYIPSKIALLNSSLYILVGIIISLLFLISLYMLQLSPLFDICIINNLLDDNTALISGVLIGLSALLASTSMMKTMHNTNQIAEQTKNRDLFDRKLIIYTILQNFLTELRSLKVDFPAAVDMQHNLIPVEFLFKPELKTLTDNLYLDIHKMIRTKNDEREISRGLSTGETQASFTGITDYSEENLMKVNQEWAELSTKCQKSIIEIQDLIKIDLNLI